MTMPKKSDPLSVEEMTLAADTFFPLFTVVSKRMPKGSSTEDILKVMETVAKLGHKLRADKLDDARKERFGFNKEDSPNDDSDS